MDALNRSPAARQALRAAWRRWAWLLVLLLGLAFSWARPLDQFAQAQLDGSLKRAALAFASARALNAGLSQLQSITVGGSLGLSGTVAPFAWLDPLDDLVEQVSSVFFVALLSLGGLRALAEVSASAPVAWFLTALLLGAAVLRWRLGHLPLMARRLVLAALCLRLVVPVYGLVNELAYRSLRSSQEAALASISVSRLPTFSGGLSTSASTGAGVIDTIKQQLGLGAPEPTRPAPAAQASPKPAGAADRSWAEGFADGLVRLAGLFVVQVLLLPLLALSALRWVYGLLTAPPVA